LRVSKIERQRQLRELLGQNPLQTDEELAEHFGVSVPTIRLDRMHLGIPEMRLRSENLARRSVNQVRAMHRQEMVGELVDLNIGHSGRSVLDTDAAMAFAHTGVLRGHYIFAQADSLAIAVVDGDVVLTGLVNAKFKQPVMAGEQISAYAEVIRKTGPRWVVLVESQVRQETVFRAKFVVFAVAALTAAKGGSRF
jgi:acyl-coenzyme A thioesterase PaaI-like protein